MFETKTVIIGSIEAEITNGCICTEVDDDGMEVLDEYGEPKPSQYCYDCFDEEKSLLDYDIIQPWMSMNGIEEGDLIRIEGSNMGWTHARGYTYCKAGVEGIVEALSINTEWILRFKLDNGKLSVVRSSHDELGAGFEFRLATEEEREEWA